MHIGTSHRRLIGQFFVTHQARHFFNQIFFDFNIEAIGRSLNAKDLVFKRKFKAQALKAFSHRGRIDVHTDHLTGAIGTHLHLMAFRQNSHGINDRANGRRFCSANFRHQTRDVI